MILLSGSKQRTSIRQYLTCECEGCRRWGGGGATRRVNTGRRGAGEGRGREDESELGHCRAESPGSWWTWPAVARVAASDDDVERKMIIYERG